MYSSMYIDLALARCDQCIFVHIHMRNSKGYTKSEPSWRRVFGPVSSFCLIWYHYLEQNRTFGLYTCIYTYRYDTLCAILVNITLSVHVVIFLELFHSMRYTLCYFLNNTLLQSAPLVIHHFKRYTLSYMCIYICIRVQIYMYGWKGEDLVIHFCCACIYTYVYVYTYTCIWRRSSDTLCRTCIYTCIRVHIYMYMEKIKWYALP